MTQSMYYVQYRYKGKGVTIHMIVIKKSVLSDYMTFLSPRWQ